MPINNGSQAYSNNNQGTYGQAHSQGEYNQNTYSPGNAYGPGTYGQGGYGYNYGYDYGYDAQPFDQDLADFIGDNYDFYFRKKSTIQQKRSIVSWNWCSFLFGYYWLFYRKMYLYGFTYLFIAFLLSIVLLPTGIFLGIAIGMFGNHLYLKYAESKVAIAKNMDPVNKSAFIQKKGGTSGLAVFLLIAASTLFTFVSIMMTGSII